ncbi:MAG: alpha/beta fold hydrolase [Pseudomonadales bacterium]
MRKAYVDIPQGQLHYLTEGTGIPLVLCHQSPNCSRMFTAAIPLLAEAGFRVLAFDTPGHGESSPLQHEPSIPDYARALLSGLDALELEHFHLLGHHTGAAIAAEMAVSAAGRVDSLILNGPPLFSPDTRAQRRLKDPLRIVPTEGGQHLLTLWELRKRVTPGWSDLRVMQRAVVDLLRCGNRVHQGHAAVYDYDLEQALMQLNVPTLILTNTGEDLYQHSLATFALRPDAFKLSELPGGTHDIVDEQPVAWSHAVASFVAQVVG